MSDLRDMMAAYFEGRLNAEQVAELEAWIRADRRRAVAAVREAMIDCHLQELLREQNLHQVAADRDDGLLSELAELEDSDGSDALDVTALLAEERQRRLADNPEQQLTKQDLATAVGFVFREALHAKATRYAAAAAAVLIAAVVLIQWAVSGPGPAAPPPVSIQPEPDTPKAWPVVATVTDGVNAQWRAGDKPIGLPTGTGLHAWQRVTLARGFAEITTKRGATLLLQAPCTIELTDSNNAMRLHRGRLVGKCLTPRSKGLVVHAPGIDVVDLGTEFGVEADPEAGSTVLVMAGAVRAQPSPESPRVFEPVVLYASQARRVTPKTGALEVVEESEVAAFISEKPHPYVAAVLDAAPVAYWRFEEQRNRTIVNEVEPGRLALRIQGSASIVDGGLLGKAGWLDNNQAPFGYFNTIGELGPIAPEDPFTLEMWCWIGQELTQSTGSGSLGGIYGQDDGLANQLHIAHIELQPTDSPTEWHPGSIRAHYTDLRYQDGDIHGLFSKTPFRQGVWHHVTLTRQDNQLRLYLDGAHVGSLRGNQMKTESAAVAIGRSMWLDRYLKQCKIDEVALYRRALSAEEVQDHWRNGSPGQSPEDGHKN